MGYADHRKERLRRSVEEARASLDAGYFVLYEDVRRWLQSWGSEAELPPPSVRKRG